ncbi:MULTISPECIES: hypothetical protein [Aeromonas]|nr:MULTISPECIES: hypothetical protein [Aeromonas]
MKMTLSSDNWVGIIVPLVSFLAGFLLNAVFMTKKDREELKLKKQELSNILESDVTEAGSEYTTALAAMNPRDFDSFMKVNDSGEKYFNALNKLACSIVSRTTDKDSTINSHVIKIRDAYTRTIPDHYKTLSYIAENCDIPYKGKFRAENYKSLRVVIDLHRIE